MFKICVFTVLVAVAWAANLPVDVIHEGKIVNGVQTTVKELPYQVSVQLKYYGKFFHICGGALISGNVVVSAAHCFHP
jgi:secreted trypsin-like serine protease